MYYLQDCIPVTRFAYAHARIKVEVTVKTDFGFVHDLICIFKIICTNIAKMQKDLILMNFSMQFLNSKSVMSVFINECF